MIDHTKAIRQFNATEQGRQQRPSGILAPLAIHQLRAWQDLARSWVVTLSQREGQWHAICPNCDQTILVVENDSGGYFFTNEELLAGTVAHLRNRHRNLDPDHE